MLDQGATVTRLEFNTKKGLFGETRKSHMAFLMLVDGRSKILSRKYS